MTAAPPHPVYEAYRQSTARPSGAVLAWNVYGNGIERVGRDGQPELVDVPRPAAGQLLVRVDAVGLCFSDVKLIRLGGDHPKLYGRDLELEPTRIGHEASITVLEVGEELRDRFRPGQRFAIQPDIYVDGRSMAYGYTIPGGLIEAHVMGPEVLAADDGTYLVEVDERLGYAETALTEPWACVEAAYTQRRRLEPLVGGRMLIEAGADDERPYRFGAVLDAPREIVVSGAGRAHFEAIAAAAGAGRVTSAQQSELSGEFDDVILLRPRDPLAVARAADRLAFRGVLNLVGDEPIDGPVEIDVGRIHYHYTAYVGTTGLDVAAAYGETRNRAELRPGGVTAVVGAAGPMGQMHVERALGLPDGPRLVLGFDLDPVRLAAAADRLRPVADSRRRELILEVLGPEPDALARAIAAHADGALADDVIVTAPSVKAVAAAAEALVPDGMLVLFAGVPVGTRTALDLSPVFLTGAQYTGTSGSRISDQALVVEKSLGGELEPRRALAAVGGMGAAQDALRALVEGRFPGKIVIFPALRGLPLTPLTDLASIAPEVAAALDRDGSWTMEAEAQLFARYLPAPVI